MENRIDCLFDVSSQSNLSNYAGLIQHHICSMATLHARIVLVGADWVMELDSASRY